ncbi:serine/threonine-protein phosphatase 6 regulatory ankyrin repeat subunit A-like [Schistocerca piceifrons]|uniref:serine/threonine-protein phosphatase 6 regulatory ankyrin repeat subunit A-like n=1 Tax=Schistocerca piceifrons TaxID=274613 RepID=UPI001F5E8B70|nr:serine/threonine-protein phosphatase 6 regulatory ankyrin repeat subunit A-like [Schistocerca piceifrons]
MVERVESKAVTVNCCSRKGHTSVRKLLPALVSCEPPTACTPASADGCPRPGSGPQGDCGHTPATAAPPTASRTAPPPDDSAVSRLRSLPEKEKNSRLMQAAKEDSVGELQMLLAAGADVGARDESEDSYTALHWAAVKGHEKAARCLVEGGADVDARGKDWQETPLHRAAHFGHEAVARLLLEAGAEADARNKTKSTPLLLAAEKGHADVVRLLLAATPYHSARNQFGGTPLHYAAENGHTVVASALLEAGADRWAKNNDGKTPLDLSRQKNHQQLIDMLSAPASADGSEPQGDRGRTPATAAPPTASRTAPPPDDSAVSRLRYIDDAQEVDFIRKAAVIGRELHRLNVGIAGLQETRLPDAGSIREDNYTFFCQGKPQDEPRLHGTQKAADSGDAKAMYDGIKKAFGPTVRKTAPLKSKTGEVVTDEGNQMERWVEHYLELYAAENEVSKDACDAIKQMPVMEELDAMPSKEELSREIDSLGNGKAPGEDGIPAEVIKYNKSLPEKEKNSRLIQAAKEDAVTELQTLLAVGADVRARDEDEDRYTALHWAAGKGHENATRCLLEGGAEVDARTSGWQETPLYRAAYNGHEAVVRLLLEAGAEADARNKTKSTPLLAATEKGHVAVVRLLLAATPYHSARNQWGRTPLHYAALNGHAEAASALLEAGADRTTRDSQGKTPLDFARENNNQQMIDILR